MKKLVICLLCACCVVALSTSCISFGSGLTDSEYGAEGTDAQTVETEGEITADMEFYEVVAVGSSRQVFEAIRAGGDVRQVAPYGEPVLVIAAALNPNP